MAKKITPKKPSIALAESNPLVAKFIALIIDSSTNVEVAGVAGCYNTALDLVSASQPNLALVDVMLAGGTGFELVRELKKKGANTKIILTSQTMTKKLILQALKVEVSGFLDKLSLEDELPAAIGTILSGKKYFSKDCTEILLSENMDDEVVNGSDQSIVLTNREKEILSHIAKGEAVHHIADTLCVSPRTVETHKRNIMLKLNVKSTVELVKLIYDNQILV
ncbi:MAG: LuxR C-terminal-related transcriptional regulator [Chloroflexota bacterium]